MEWWNLGVGIAGLVASIVGLTFAFFALLAATSAKKAATEAREALTRTLRLVDVERAVAMISHLKLLHRMDDWSSAAELYQYLRRMLSEIYERTPEELYELRIFFSEAIPRISVMENEVRQSVRSNEENKSDNLRNVDGILNDVQQNLEILQSADIYRR